MDELSENAKPDDATLLMGIQRSDGSQKETFFQFHRGTDGWQLIGGRTVELFNEGQASANEVASVPSLHSGVTMLVALFLWSRVPRPVRPLLALYPLAMGLTLMATGEHYFFDVLLGWIYAGSVMGAWTWWERRRARATVDGGRCDQARAGSAAGSGA